MASLDLNIDQLKAVEHPGGPLLVLAGPGTGKTGVLVARISHLVGERDVRPGRVLALTFSRRAADEMRARVTARLPEAEKVEVRTFHSFALSVVRRHAGSLGLRSAPEIVPTNEQWALVSDILGTEDSESWGLPHGAFERPATVREVYDLMLRAQEHLHGPKALRELGEETGRPYLVRAGAVLERYIDRLKWTTMTDYEGVVQYALRLLMPGGRTAGEISGLYDHVLVDEFQDTNRSQMELLKRLMPGESPNVFCVGDDAQSIYSFRGARIENVREFGERFPGAREIHLRTNYRSAAHIVSLAEQAIAGDESRPRRDPQNVASIKKLGTVLHKVASSPREEGEWISDRIVELTQGQGVPREEIAILRRSLLDAAPLVDALASRGVPVDMAVSPGGSSARHLATLLAASDGEEPDPTPAASALVSPLCGVAPEAARALRAASEASGRPVFGLVRSGDSVVGIPDGEIEKARAVVQTVDAAAQEDSFAAKVDALWKGLPATKGLFESHAQEQESALALTDALSFVRSAHAYARMSQRPSVDGFLRAGKMLHEDSDTWAPSAPPAEDAVRLLTVHGSKGLEFEAVFVSGLVDERFPIRPRGVRFVDPGLLSSGTPTPRALLDQSHMFEERRLFYVALTRAKTYLFLTGVEERSEDGMKASPFLRELEDRLVELAESARPRRFWVSREEAIEELRRATCDQELPEPSRFAAARALAQMGERPLGEDGVDGWWRYLEQTEGSQAFPELGDLRARELLLHLDCPRRAFMERVSSGPARRGGTGRMAFGSVFGDGLRRFLEGDGESLRDAVLASVEERDFGGPAFKEYWRRQALDAVASCEAWAHETRENLVTPNGEWEIEVGGHKVHGRHGPLVEESGERVLVRVRTGKNPMKHAEAAVDPDLALTALGAEVDRAKYVYPRKLSYGAPAERELDTSEGLEGFRAKAAAAVAEMELGEIPARPRSAEICGRCAFISICPLHMEDEPWAG
ncbi:MAG TPA: ATP-dependent DNA helicase [Rubrobacter sp.]|nr:ATP-dependent DNA helicase [Rubrobacter sp.]